MRFHVQEPSKAFAQPVRDLNSGAGGRLDVASFCGLAFAKPREACNVLYLQAMNACNRCSRCLTRSRNIVGLARKADLGPELMNAKASDYAFLPFGAGSLKTKFCCNCLQRLPHNFAPAKAEMRGRQLCAPGSRGGHSRRARRPACGNRSLTDACC